MEGAFPPVSISHATVHHHGSPLLASSTSSLSHHLYSGKDVLELLGPLGTAPLIWGKCVFVDPVSDLAVLGSPDGQAFDEDVGTAWDEFIEDVEPLQLDTDQPIRGWMLSLDGYWMPCTIQIMRHGALVVKDAVGGIADDG
jgi:hypothetical protein